MRSNSISGKHSKQNRFFNKYKYYIILMIAAAALLCVFLGVTGSEDQDKVIDTGAESNGNPGMNTNIDGLRTASDIPVKYAEDGITLMVPGCVINGAEHLYENSCIINNPEDLLCIVNKKFNLSSDYSPQDLVTVEIPFSPGRTDDVKQMRAEASSALTELYKAAEREGYMLYGASGYRSYNTQMVLFNKSAESKGSISEANKLNALPGQSEHQLGLAMDFTLEELNYTLNQSFGETEEGIWLKENCHKFGFIIRYPKEKEHITGYSYEPWHCRYVGKEAAEYIYENDLTLEEFYSLI